MLAPRKYTAYALYRVGANKQHTTYSATKQVRGIRMDITTIKKRDGRIVGFDRAKIVLAMEGAAREVNPNTDLRPFSLIVDHVLRHIQLKYGEATPDVEGVQDLVEQTLMEHGHYEVAKAYILYRAEHSKN